MADQKAASGASSLGEALHDSRDYVVPLIRVCLIDWSDLDEAEHSAKLLSILYWGLDSRLGIVSFA